MIVRAFRAVAGILLTASFLAGCGQNEGVHPVLGGPAPPGPTLVAFVSRTTPQSPAQTRTGTETLAGTGDGPTGSTASAAHGDGPLQACPVRGRGYYVSNFGAYRAGPPVHPHQGNDVFAPYGTPIVAPFEGIAVATPNVLGGKAVKVFGTDGYVYNAHLSRYGALGRVGLGEVIGFVGNTGNAAASLPHDHFEWHPDDGPAVDPFPYLNEACPPG